MTNMAPANDTQFSYAHHTHHLLIALNTSNKLYEHGVYDCSSKNSYNVADDNNWKGKLNAKAGHFFASALIHAVGLMFTLKTPPPKYFNNKRYRKTETIAKTHSHYSGVTRDCFYVQLEGDRNGFYQYVKHQHRGEALKAADIPPSL